MMFRRGLTTFMCVGALVMGTQSWAAEAKPAVTQTPAKAKMQEKCPEPCDMKTMEKMQQEHNQHTQMAEMSEMDHSKMMNIDHSKMGQMDHSKMMNMDHSKMDHSNMNQSAPKK